MKIVCIVPVNNPDVYSSHFGKSVDRLGLGVINIGNDDQNPQNNTQIMKYALGANYAIQNKMIDNDTIVVYSREDVFIMDSLFAQKLNAVFQKRPDVGIIGVEGARSIDRDWNYSYQCGHYIQATDSDGVGNGKHIVHGSSVGFYDDCVVVGNSLFAVRGSLFLANVLPNVSLAGGEHVCSFDMSFQCLSRGFGVAVADILVYCGSRLGLDGDVAEYKNQANLQYTKLMDLYESFGNVLPATNKSFIKNRNEVVTIDL